MNGLCNACGNVLDSPDGLAPFKVSPEGKLQEFCSECWQKERATVYTVV